ncbi:MAG: Slp family lipoprotein [Nitrospira sp.]|jgi:starvation-inducible outer membrane lipoprotein|nr:Slp family lipoprotein [Nitrospira sp.]
MKFVTLSTLLLAGLTLSACAPTAIFPPDIVKGVDPNFDFARWRMVPNQAEAKKIQLGGRIVNAETKGEKVTVVVAQLPIVEHPAYGPKDTGKRSGEFAVTYQGKVDSTFLQPGNRIMVIGTTHAPMVISVDDLPRSLPTVAATCLHFWKTGGRDIADFPSYGAGYETLEEETVCATTP